MDEGAPKHRWLDGESLAAFGIYLGLSLLFFGRGLIGHFGDRYIGAGPDAPPAMYLMLWWPYAISHRINPLINRFAWAPDGVNLAKVPSMPFAALFVAPITLIGGPVRGLNALLLSLLTLSAWAAFGLYRKICNRFWPSIAGGYLFGFSPFMLGHMLGQPHLLAGVFIAFAVYLTLARLDCEISARGFAILMTLVLSGQFGFSLEILATASMFGAIALAIAWLEGEAELRARIAALIAPLACAYAATIMIAAPYLVYFFRAGPLAMPYHLTISASARPLNFLVPTPANALGRFFVGGGLAVRGTNIYEAGSFIGLPALLMIAVMAMRRSGEIIVKMGVAMLVVIATLSLGPILLIGPHRGILMPEALLYFFAPLFKNAMPARFAAFFFLCVGALFALWLSDKALSSTVRWGLGAIVLLSLAPNLNASFWLTNVDTPGFFRNGLYRKYIAPDETIMILPYGITGTSDIWQADARHFFRTAGGYLSLSPPVPQGYREWPAVPAFFGLYEIPELHRNIAAFLANKHVGKVIVADGGAHVLQAMFSDGPASWRLRAFNSDEQAAIDAFFAWLDPAPLHVGGATIYRIPPDRLAKYAQYTPEELQLETGRTYVRTLVAAANSYLAQGGELAKLNLVAAADRDLIPRRWLTDPAADKYLRQWNSRNGLTLKGGDGVIEIGVTGTGGALRQIAAEYKADATSARILPPETAMNVADWVLPVLRMRFDRPGLAKAAAYAARQEASPAANASEAREKGAFAGVHD